MKDKEEAICFIRAPIEMRRDLAGPRRKGRYSGCVPELSPSEDDRLKELEQPLTGQSVLVGGREPF